MGKNHTEICPSCMLPDRKCQCMKWCGMCRAWSNHDTREHQQAERDMPKER